MNGQSPGQLIREALSDGVPPAPVLGDAVYEDNAEFREGLRQLEMDFFPQVDPSKHKGWDHPVETEMKRVRRRIRDGQPAERTLAEIVNGWSESVWKPCSGVPVGGQTRQTRLAWGEVFLQQGLEQPEGELEKLWLVVDWPKADKEPYHYYLASGSA